MKRWRRAIGWSVVAGALQLGPGAHVVASQSDPTTAVLAIIDSVTAAGAGSVAGFSVGVVLRGDTLFLGSRGYADASARIPVEPDDPFEAGSIAKQFTAAAIHLLADAGRIQLDRSAKRYLPYLPLNEQVTVRQLLDHTSGLPDLASQPAFRWGATDAPGLEHLMPIASAVSPPHGPGGGMTYSNTNYLVLAELVEVASGDTFSDFLERELFAPAGMSSTSVCTDRRDRRVRGHTRVNGSQQPFEFLNLSWWLGAGALCSNVRDLLAWNEALHGGLLLSLAGYERMVEPGTVGGGLRTRYAAGLMVDSIFGRPVHRHGGSLPGFRSYLAHYPSDDLSVVVLANSTELNSTAFGEALARAALGASSSHLPPFPSGGDYAGLYQGDGREGPVTISLTVTPGGELTWGRDGRPGARLYLRAPDIAESAARDRLHFVREGGRVVGVWLDRVGGMFYLQRKQMP